MIVSIVFPSAYKKAKRSQNEAALGLSIGRYFPNPAWRFAHARSKSVYPSVMHADPRQDLAVQCYPDPREKKLAMINLKRAYDPVTSTDGIRLLVERLWPRGVKKTSLRVKRWLKDVAPSTELRKWFSHDPAKWDQFRSRYFDELEAKPDAWQPILQAARRG